jgi:putative peptide zinc metalloprotease protein
MSATWFDELNDALAQPRIIGSDQPSIWNDLKNQVDINEYKPCPHPAVVAQEIQESTGNYFVLKNAKNKTYMRLSPDEYNLWSLMDGKKSVKELVVDYFVTYGAFSRNKVTQLVNQLLQNHLLKEEPQHVWTGVNAQLQKRSLLHKISMPAQMLLSQQLKIPGIDGIITFIYRSIGWLFYTRPLQVLMAIVSLVGFVLMNLIIKNPDYVLFSGAQPSEIAMFWLAAILPIFIHELGHALTVKHYGREINAGGLMLYFGLPAAYIDTTDIWLANRRARLNVTWNGPYTGLVIGGICAILMWVYPTNPSNPFLFKMASVAYLTILININPFLKYDGYYLLSDALNISFLRERSLNFLQKDLFGKIIRREKLTRDEKIFSVFGVLSAAWTAYALYLAFAFWQTRLNSGLQVLLGSNYSFFTKILEFLSVGAFISLLILLGLQFIRFIASLVNRFVQTGGLQRHGQLAIIGLAFAAVISFTAANAVDIYRGWIVIAIASGMSIATLIAFVIFNQTYQMSNRWLAQTTLALALLLLALIPLAEELMPTGWIHTKYLIVGATAFASLGGFLFIFPAIKQVKPLQIILGILTAVLLVAAGYFLRLFNWTLMLVPLMGLVLTLNWFSARGSGRISALTLIHLGIVITAAAFVLARYIPRYWGLGILITCTGFWHLMLARLPNLSKFEALISPQKHDAIGYSVAILVKRVIAQVFFESGWGGIESFGKSFTGHTKSLGINLSIDGNQFNDGELLQRATFDLTEVYGIAFDKIFTLMKERFGDQFARRVISLGVDLIPWQYREVISELVLERRDWGMELNQEKRDQRTDRIKLLDRVPLFVNATYDDLRPIAAMLSARRYAAREIVIKQGDPGHEFFIIESGTVQVWQQKQGDALPQLVQSLGPGQYFGEAALASNEPRNATIIAETPAVLLTLGREDFDALVKHHLEFAKKIKTNLSNEWVLRQMPIFDEMSAFDLKFIASKLKAEKFSTGETVIRQGERGDKFYIVESGRLAVYHEANGAVVELEHHTAGDYFGETSLIQDKPRNASVVAVADSTLFSLGRTDFMDMLGDFQNMRQSLEKTSTRRRKNILQPSEE